MTQEPTPVQEILMLKYFMTNIDTKCLKCQKHILPAEIKLTKKPLEHDQCCVSQCSYLI